MEEEQIPYKKSKRNRHPTTCQAKTKSSNYNHCLFCGSENLVLHGVKWSEDYPDTDEQFIHAGMWCMYSYSISVLACADCGAVKSGRCPNCDRNAGTITIRPTWTFWQRSAWRNNVGKLRCDKCNFREK
jgi:hypothetical protein